MFRFTRSLVFLLLMAFVVLQPTLAFADVYGSARSDGEVAMILGFYVVFLGVVMVVSLAIMAGVICIINAALKKIPPEHRLIEPEQVWLLLIPCFGLFWNFMVFRKIPQSFRSYFSSQGRTDLGDCGEQLGLWYAITVTLGLVPCVNYIAPFASLVLLIIFLIKIHSLKDQIH